MDLQCILCIVNSSYAVKTLKDEVTCNTYWNLYKKLKIWTCFPQNGRFWDQTRGQETTFQNRSLPFKTGGLEYIVCVYICMYIYMYIYIYVCVCVCLFVWVYIYVCIYIYYIYMHVYIYICIYMSVYMHVSELNKFNICMHWFSCT